MTFRKALFWTHLFFGLFAGLGIFVKAATGLVLAYEPQLLDYAERSVRKVEWPEPGKTKAPIASLVASAQAERPGKKITAVTINADPAASSTVAFGRDGNLFLNPYTANVLGKDSKMSAFMHLMDDWHRWFGFRDVGRPISGAVTLAFVFLALSGVYLWWPRRLTLRRFRVAMTVNLKLEGKARDWNWHTAIGFWSSLALLMISLTGVVMSYQWANNLLFRLAGSEPPAQQKRQEGKPDPSDVPLPDLDKILAHASTQLPNWESITLRLPQKPDGPVSASIQEPSTWGPMRRSQLTLDPITAEPKKWEPYAELSLGRRLRVWVRYLHTGEAGGIIGQTLVFLAAAAALILIWTGFALSYRRFFRRA